MCGKLTRPNKDVMSRIKEAFEAPEAPYDRTSSTVTIGGRCGPNPWQHHHKARDALRRATKGERTFTSIWDRWQHNEIHEKSQLSHKWSDAWVRNLDHIVQFDISHNAPQWQREVREPDSFTKFDSNRRDHYGRDQGTRKQKENWQMYKRSQGQVQVLWIPVSERKRQNKKLDPSPLEYLEWLSLHWADGLYTEKISLTHAQGDTQF